jgi:rod shape-determining protein MreC
VQQQQWERVKDTIINRGFHASDTSVTLTYANFIYRTARVINNEVSNTDNYITINRGSEDGIKKNMAVISSSGAVGKVVSVSKHFSSVISVLSEKQPISAKLHDGTFGPVVWEIGKPDVLIMKDVSQEVKIRRGDSVMTTNFSFFPENILIGRVFKVELIKKNSMQRIYLHTAVNFRNLQYVYVVENTFLQEKMDLEEANK